MERASRMDKVIYYGAYLLCALQIVAVLFIMKGAYGRDVFWAMLLLLPPFVAMIALKCGPDLEERRLRRKVNKARLQQELAELTKG